MDNFLDILLLNKLRSLLCHFNIFLSIFCFFDTFSFDVLALCLWIFCSFDVILSIFLHILFFPYLYFNIFPRFNNYLALDTLTPRFVLCVTTRFFAYDILSLFFRALDTLTFYFFDINDILHARYFTYLISCDSAFATSIFCDIDV